MIKHNYVDAGDQIVFPAAKVGRPCTCLRCGNSDGNFRNLGFTRYYSVVEDVRNSDASSPQEPVYKILTKEEILQSADLHLFEENIRKRKWGCRSCKTEFID